MTDPRPGSGERPGLDDLLARVERMEQQAEATLRKYEDFRERVGGLASEGVTDDGAVRVVLDEQGEVTGVEIAESAMRHRGNLSRWVMTALQRAQAQHASRMGELAQELMGGRLDVAAMVREAIPAEVREAIEQDGGNR